MLKTIYFLRHGLAAERDEWTGDDALRPLTGKGKKNMGRTAETISELGVKLDIILTSPLVRSHQTAEIIAGEMDLVERLKLDDRLSPGFSLPALSELIKDYPDAEEIMLVGHEPDFSLTISDLIGGGRVVCKKGGLARVDVIFIEPLQGELVWLLQPRVLNG